MKKLRARCDRDEYTLMTTTAIASKDNYYSTFYNKKNKRVRI